jgi:radical SAM-linked protein
MPPDLSTAKTDASLSSPTQSLSPPARAQEPPRFKFRIRFRKAGDIRLVSHHDLMHVVERMFRRAELRCAETQGFHPRPKMAFALSLALGVAGHREVLEFELRDPLAAEEIERRLARQCPPGLVIVDVKAIDIKSSAAVRRAFYRVLSPFPLADGCGVKESSLADRSAEFLKLTDFWIDRSKPANRRINVRPFVSELRANVRCVEMALWITPNGAARPEEVLAALGMGDWLDAGAIVERTDLELTDELPPDAPAAPVIAAAIEEKHTNAKEPTTASRPRAIVDNPLSFDT